MDAEDDEARAEPSPPLQQPPSDAPTTASQCETDTGNHVITGELSEAAAVDEAASAEENKDDVVGVVKEEVTDVEEVAPEAVKETVAEETEVAGDAEKENEPSSVDGDGMGDEAMERNGNEDERVVEGTDVYDVAVKEERTDLVVGQDETNGDEIRDAEVAEEMEEANEADLMEEQEGREEEDEEEADAGGGMENEAALMKEDEGIRAEEEEDEEIRAEEDDEVIRAEEEDDEEIRAEEDEEEIPAAEEEDEEIPAAAEEDEEEIPAAAEEDEEEEEEETATAADVTEAAEEEMEEQARSVSGGKRKRGAGKNSKSAGRLPSKKKMEEDVCFICFDGGDLVLCDRRWECRHIFSISNALDL